ncbi:3-oxoadipate enol-lactonase [Pelagibacterium xiamenense]|uniref:3-oxoadipate enol-lactonase n=1 Tax=Pelagibacterium xiamenense TaxID=2901140 RepID=UPI001E443091|nr:3-oxoadipate enol-lactonase [Pelagibacterium xiamenense]MCD7060674.1 3-oxoadipate enol-lactonase [Pelagibacterium xiamenense]
MQFARLEDVTIHYRLSGLLADKPVIVMVNSLGTDLRIWDDVVQALESDYAVLVYDKRGHGLSDLGTPPYRIEDHADDLIALLAFLGIGKAVFCGLSVGGQVVQAVYARMPELVAGIVFSNTAPKIGDAAFWDRRIAAVEAGGLEAIAEGVLERWFSAGFRQRESGDFPGYRNMLLRQPVDGYTGTCAAIRDFDMKAQAGEIAVPAACIVGSADGATPPDLVSAFADHIAGAKFHLIEGVGHIPCVEAPERVSAIIRDIAEAAFSEQGAQEA